jgi:DNA end-binding protein Ku
MGTRKVWSGFINLGLLSIPVNAGVGARDKRVELHTYHIACNGPVKSPKYCPTCAVQLQDGEIYKGYGEPPNVTPLSKEEIEALKPATEKVMEISETVLWKDVDPVYLAESYYLWPDTAGLKAYSLLVKTLIDTGRCAVAKLTKSSREHIVILRPKDNGLMMHFSWYQDEIAEVPEFDNLQLATLSANEMKLAKQLVESLASDFQPEQYQDAYRGRLNQLIQSKLDSSVKAPAPVAVVVPKTVDITEALMASLKKPKAAKEPVSPVSVKAAKKGKKVA